jgi:hypothetical protein
MFNWSDIARKFPSITEGEWQAVRDKYGDYPTKELFIEMDENRPPIKGIKQNSACKPIRVAIINECTRVEREEAAAHMDWNSKHRWLDRVWGFATALVLVAIAAALG